MTKVARQAWIGAVISLLCDNFPQTFSRGEQHPRPLKVGVYADALAALGGAIQPRDLKSALRAYTSRASYLRALTAGAPRVGIDGESAGAVTPDEEAVAKVRLAELAKRTGPPVVPAKTSPAAQTDLETPAQTSAAKVAKPPAPAAPKRLSLADLREAGREASQGLHSSNQRAAERPLSQPAPARPFLGSDRFDLPVFFALPGPSSASEPPNLSFRGVGRDAVAAASRRACLSGSAI